MSESSHPLNRRTFLKRHGTLTATAALLSGLPAGVFAADDPNIRLALIGCGGRGTGAAANALGVPGGGTKLYAMADLHQDKITGRLAALKKQFPEQVDVPSERMFTGFDAYKAAIDVLRPGDVALCTTRAYIRPIHVEYAVSKGINVFMEKPFASDPAGLQRMLKAAESADQTGSKILCGLQCRHSPARQALINKVRDGELGEVNVVRANRLASASWMGDMGEKALRFDEQLQFGRSQLMWVGSGQMVDNLIHQIDECCWIFNEWPVQCVAMGGRTPNSTDRGQNLDQYAMEFTFPGGGKAFCGFRRQKKTRTEFASWIQGSKRAAQFSGSGHAATVHMYKDTRIRGDLINWRPPNDAYSPWQYEWNDFIEAIRQDQPFNEGKRAVYADIASLMGRAATHTGQVVTWDQVMKSDFQFCDYLDTLNFDSPVPVKPGANGQFEIPVPGAWKEV